MTPKTTQLKKGLSVVHLWGIAVGLVISGEYFGWSYGWANAGTLGFLLTSAVIALMYTTFIFSFTELTAAIPQAGGPFSYAQLAFGPLMGLVGGYATLLEFVFAPPAIALAIGSYLNIQFPMLDPRNAAIGAYLVFMALNIAGITIAATFELLVTVLAVGELLVFMLVVAPGFHWSSFRHDGWAGHTPWSASALGGVLAAVPFAIWFFLGIEGVAMAAEEARDPRRSIPIAYVGGILTLVALAFGTMLFAGAVGDWHQLANINDPLPRAMQAVVGSRSGYLQMLVWIGLFGLVASFHGIIMGYSRQIFALARAGFLPSGLARLHPRLKTPHWAILAGGVVGIITVSSDRLLSFAGQTLTANVVTLSAFGALVAYIISMLSLFRLRRSMPELERPFRAPCYPLFPAIALVTALIALGAMVYFSSALFLLFVVLFVPFWIYYRFGGAARRRRELAMSQV